jgi:uncharacterized protein YlxP (DUF503 family)
VVVGALTLTLHVPDSQSLKDKRQVISSLLARVRRQFNVAAAEVGDQDTWQLATLGFVCISNDRRLALRAGQPVGLRPNARSGERGPLDPVTPLCSVTGVAPDTGPASGGTLVHVYGTGFLYSGLSPAPTVNFWIDANHIASVYDAHVVSNTEMTLLTPPLTTGVAHVIIGTAICVSMATPADHFTYTAG